MKITAAYYVTICFCVHTYHTCVECHVVYGAQSRGSCPEPLRAVVEAGCRHQSTCLIPSECVYQYLTTQI